MMAGLVGLSLGGQVVTADVLEGQANSRRAESQKEEPSKRVAKGAATPESDLELLQGTWFGVVTEIAGKGLPGNPARLPPQVKLIIKGDRLHFRGPRLDKPLNFGTVEDREFTLKLGGEEKLLTIDLTLSPIANDKPQLSYLGIYSLGRGHLFIGLNAPGQKRPKDFKTKAQMPQILLDLNLAVLSDDESLSAPLTSPMRVKNFENDEVQRKAFEDRKRYANSRNRELFGDR
jgi:RNA polymerase sigma-70 factor (ECF subfamily)